MTQVKLTEDQIKNKMNFLKKEHNIASDKEAHDAIEFVFELIEAEVDILKANEPYATGSIKKLQDVKYDIRDLQNYFEG